MKRTIMAAALAIAAFGATAAPLEMPGYNWSEFTVNPGVIKDSREEGNYLLQGKIEQGVVWARLGDWKVNTYGSLGYSVDKNGLDYNNKLVPAIGVKLTRPFENGVLNVGVQAVHENHFRGTAGSTGPTSGNGVQLFVNYWFGWNLKK